MYSMTYLLFMELLMPALARFDKKEDQCLARDDFRHMTETLRNWLTQKNMTGQVLETLSNIKYSIRLRPEYYYLIPFH